MPDHCISRSTENIIRVAAMEIHKEKGHAHPLAGPARASKIGNNVTVEILAVARWGDQVRICIKAPKDIEVYRDEVCERTQREQSESNAAVTRVPITPGC